MVSTVSLVDGDEFVEALVAAPVGAALLANAPVADRHTAPQPRTIRCRPLNRLGVANVRMWPNEMVPLQIDLAMDAGRYLVGPPPSPSDQKTPSVLSAVDRRPSGITGALGAVRCVSVCGEAAIDSEGDAVDEAGGGTGEPEHGSRDSF